MNPVPRFDPLTFGETALKLRTYRHELLSANLVNADTPNYKARDIDFSNVLEQQLQGKLPQHSLRMQRTDRRHLAGLVSTTGPEHLFRVPVQPSADGNTVDPDIERGNFVKNAMLTEATLGFLGSTLKSRLSSITGQAL